MVVLSFKPYYLIAQCFYYVWLNNKKKFIARTETKLSINIGIPK